MRLRTLLRIFLTLLLTFVLQKVLFMLYNMGMADGVPFLSCLASLWHGLRLDIATACYLVVLPTVLLIISVFFKRFPLRKVLMPYYVLVAVVLSLIFVADTVLYGFWGAKLDANDLIYAAKPKDMLASLPLWATVLAFVVVAGVTTGYVLLLRWVTPKVLDRPSSFLASLSPYLLVTPLIFLGMRGGVTESTANPSYAYFSQHPFCNHAALNPVFNMMHSLFKVQDLGGEFDSLPEEEVDTLLADVFEPDNTLTDTLLRIERPNILLVIWEGAGLGMVGSDTVAPNLHRYMREGISFTNCYANSYRTDRGLVSVLSGWLGLPTTTLMKRTDLCRCLPSIAASLKEAGYLTSMTYGGDIDFTNMRLYFSETGFSTVRGGDAFPSDQRTSAWGVPDHHLFASILHSPFSALHSPFFTTALTLSSHEPWEVPLHRLDDAKRNSFAYTDSCLGVLIDSLKSMPMWDSLLVIIVPDHGIPYVDGMSTSEVSVARIPMVWIGGALAKQDYSIDCLMSQSDLAATLLAQMRVAAGQYPFSRNVLGTKYAEKRQFAIHSDKNCLNLVTPEGCWHYDCVSRTLQPESPEQQRFIEALLQRLYKTSASLSLTVKH